MALLPKFADADEKARRLKICRSCPHLKTTLRMETCGVGCGCVGKFKARLNSKNGTCPKDKW